MNNEQKQLLLQKFATPFYVFDEAVLRARVQYLKAHLPSSVQLCYAVKANTFISPCIADIVERFEVCSPGEMSITEAQQIPPQKLVISGVYKTPEIITEHILSAHTAAYYTAESFRQFELLKAAARKANKRIRILPRLSASNQFGMNEEEIIALIQAHKEDTSIDICGIQYFSGTQKTSLKKYKRELTHLADFMKQIEAQTGVCLKELEYGTGFPVNYFEGGEFDEEGLLAEFSALLSDLSAHYTVTLEIGRSIAASCGYYFTKAVDLKTNHNQNFAIMDGGIHHIAYFGQFMAMKHPYLEQFPPKEGEVKSWTLCGSLCTVNDILVKDLPLTTLEVGDTVIFKNAGAYCPTEGISLFLSRALPAVVLLQENNQSQLLRDNTEIFEYNFGSKK